MHKEPGLNEGEGLAEAHGRELSNDDRGDAWVLAVMPVDSVADDRARGATWR